LFTGDSENGGKEQIVGPPTYRIITTPGDAKQLLRHLEYTIEEYEKVHGAIAENTQTPP
jgi:translation initiation factor 2 alpha subunit (eIF-2alpha)